MRGARLAIPLFVLALARAASAAEAACVAIPSSAPSPSEAVIELQRANALLRGDHPQEAIDAYAKGENLARAAGDGRTALLASANRARALLAAGRTESLAATLDRVAAEASTIEDTKLRATVLTNVARTWVRWRGPGPPGREERLLRASALLQEAEAAAVASGDARLQSYALGYRASLYEEAERIAEAMALTRRALHRADAAHAPEVAYLWQWQLGRLQRRAGNREAALDRYRQATRILGTLRAEQVVDELRFRDDVKPVYRELTDLLLQRARDVEAPAARQLLLAEARETLEAFRAAELREYFGDPCLDAQRTAMPESVPGAVVLHPIVLPDRLELLVGRGERLVSVRVPVSGEELEAELRSFRQLATKATTRQYLRPARRLYEWLIRPIEAELSDPELRALVILPDGPLRLIPMAALRDERTGRFLIEQVPLAIAPGLTLIDPRRIEPENTRVLASGITSAVQGFAALAGVPAEMQAIASHFEGRQLLDGEFLADRFQAELTRSPYQIVHIASHGEFRSDASESFVLAWDRKISMDQLAEMIAKTRFRTELPLEMLVLSACQSAVGDDRAALGLAGVALRSGARSAVASLWSVSDEASSLLMRRFYAELAGRASRAEALRRAQIELLRGNFEHPYHWAAFVLISSWL